MSDLVEQNKSGEETREIILSPCPFCGADTKEMETDPDTGAVEPAVALHTWVGKINTYVVQCCRCGCTGPFDNDSNNAIRQWNQRPAMKL